MLTSSRSDSSLRLIWRSPLMAAWSSALPRRRILVVDDDSSLQALLRILLTSSGFDVATAVNGEEALTLAQEGDFDLILLDLEMPVMNGREFFQAFRQHDPQTPVVVVSAYGAEAGRRELGAQGAISKPFDPAHVPQVVQRLLGD